MNIGILSTSSIAPRFIAAFRENGDGTILAAASRSLEKAAAFAEKWSIPRAYGSYEELLRDPDVDIAYVCMVSSEHYRYALAALEAGKHVLCEKPFTLRKEEAEHLFRAAREKGLFLAETQKAVFLPVMEAVRKLLNENALGPARFADFSSSFPGNYNSWIHSRAAGGGALYSNAGYSIALSRFLFGCGVSAYCGLCDKGDSDTDEQCAVTLRMENGLLVTTRISTRTAFPNRALISCEGGLIEIPDYWKARRALIRFADGRTEELYYPEEHELIYEIRHFLSCIREGRLRSPVMTEDMTVGTVEILEALAESWK